MGFGSHSLDIDPEAETERIVSMLRQTVRAEMRRRGGVLGISGGVDSSVVLALAIRAFGHQGVIPLMLPEKDSDPESEALARRVAGHFGVEPVLEDITLALEGFGCYARRDEAVKRIFPEYDAEAGYKTKIALARNVLDEDTLNVFRLIIVTPDGEEKSQRLPLREYFQIVAASNFKQRTRMAMLYYHAEMHHYAVIGTANKNEHMQGFFVKYGDGGVDVRAISHLLKTQVYQLAEYLDVPEEVRRRTPMTDTYSAYQTQEEFFFRLPFTTMDLLWYAHETGVPIPDVAKVMGLTEIQVQRAFNDFLGKQRATEYLRQPPVELS
ncbi:MAG: NAD(+) synthase [Anaerolineae bacterium]|nr:NAD(+) synthase [Anaerolineae bacterium]